MPYRRLLPVIPAVLLLAACHSSSAPAATAPHTLTATLDLPTITDTPITSVTPTPSRTYIIFTRPPSSTTADANPADATETPAPAVFTLEPVASAATPLTAVPPTQVDIASEPSATPVSATATPTLTPLPLVADSLPESFRPHFLMARPFDPAYTSWASRNYPYGSTAGGTFRVHHGVDIANPTGTPVRAAAEGTVLYAGDDLTTQFGPHTNFYGNLVIIEHGTLPDGQKYYSLYGHLSQVSARAGDEVELYGLVGLVGATGVAYGSHLHFEVRVGDPYDYFATRNPDLWLQNFRDPRGFGVLAGRVVDAHDQPIPDLRIELRAPSVEVERTLTTYADLNLPGDDVLHENFAIGDLLAADYDIIIQYPTGTYRNTVTVYPDRVNWLSVTLP